MKNEHFEVFMVEGGSGEFDELRSALFKVFSVGEHYFEIEGGAEYHQALIRGFAVLDPKLTREIM